MYLTCAALIATAIALSTPTSAQTIDVETSLGVVTGLTTADGVDSFLGIQFASVGERFSRSTLITGTNQTINATSHGPYCYQILPPFANEAIAAYANAPQDEECLYLNIWRPSNTTSTSLPVMFWIHGGGFSIGSGAEPLTDGSRLAKEQDVIVVSTNYRLGPFGFLVKNETTGEGGLNAMHDIINALSWVQNHIADFGGDPSQVTLFGESAGSFAVCMINVSPLAKGLFHRSIMQTGECASPLTAPNSPQFGFTATELVLNVTNTSSIEELQDYPAKELAQITAQYPNEAGWATMDGFVLTKSPFELYQDTSSIVPTDIMIGSNSFDDFNIVIWPSDVYIGLASTLEATIMQFFPENSADIIEAYSPDKYKGNQVAAYAAYNGDLFFRCPTREIVNLMAAEGNIFLYNLAHLTAFDPIVFIGLLQDANLQEFGDWSSHGADLALVFGTADVLVGGTDIMPTQADLELENEMMTRWASFAKTGNPNGGDYTGWEPVMQETSGSPSTVPSFVLQAGGGVMMKMDDKAEQCSAFPFYASTLTDDTSSATSLAVSAVFILVSATVSIMTVLQD